MTLPSEEVTLSIFRASKPKKLFREMREKGQLEENTIRGICHVKGIADFPFQIVITNKPQGPEYAAYRALTDQARKADVEQVIRDSSREADFSMRAHYRVSLDLVARKNPDMIEEIRRWKYIIRRWYLWIRN